MEKTCYKCGYGGTASITEKSDGTAVLICANQYGKRYKRTVCRSVTSAKRTLSRYTDGLYSEIKD